MTSAVTPIFKELEGGLIEYCGPTDAPTVVEHWRSFDAKIDMDIWGQASIAAAIEPVWGKETIKEFAAAVEKSSWYVRQMGRTFRYYTQKATRVANLSFKHHSISLSHDDPTEALEMATLNGWSCAKLEEWISKKAVEKATKKSTKHERQSDYREFLERVDNIILTDFMATCPNAEWGRRVFKNWRDEIAWELRQVGHEENAEYIEAAITEGALTIADIKSATGLAVRDIEGVIGIKVAEGVWEWVREGGETDVARGSRRAIIHVVGNPVFQ